MTIKIELEAKQASGAKRSVQKTGKKVSQKTYHDYLPSTVIESGDYYKDCAAGERLAFNYILFGASALPSLVRDLVMTKKPRFGGVEVGFFLQLADSLRQPSEVWPKYPTSDEVKALHAAAMEGRRPEELDLWPTLQPLEEIIANANKNAARARNQKAA